MQSPQLADQMALFIPDFFHVNLLDGRNDLKAESHFFTISTLPPLPTLSHCQCFTILKGFKGYITERQGVNSFELRLTLSGHGRLEYDGKTYDLNTGQGFFIDSHKPHRYYTVGNEWECTIIHLNGPFCQLIADESVFRQNVTFSVEDIPEFEHEQLRLLRKLQEHHSLAKYHVASQIDSLLVTLLESKTQLTKLTQNPLTEKLLQYINANFSSPINFTQLAKEWYVSRASLFAHFKKATGTTPYQYLMGLRIKKAKLLLKSTNHTIDTVAHEVGFEDASHFSQMFKKQTGMTPLHYRKES